MVILLALAIGITMALTTFAIVEYLVDAYKNSIEGRKDDEDKHEQ